jgi:hypothetical protein
MKSFKNVLTRFNRVDGSAPTFQVPSMTEDFSCSNETVVVFALVYFSLDVSFRPAVCSGQTPAAQNRCSPAISGTRRVASVLLDVFTRLFLSNFRLNLFGIVAFQRLQLDTRQTLVRRQNF